jgi:excisionase family DNA binding protein
MPRRKIVAVPSIESSLVPTTEQRYFRIAEAAEYLRAKKWTIAAAIRTKQLPYIRLGKSFVLAKADLDKFAERQRVAA